METSQNIHSTEEIMEEVHEKDTILQNAKKKIQKILEQLPSDTQQKILGDIDRIFLEKHDTLDAIAEKIMLASEPGRRQKNQDTTPNNLPPDYEDIITVVLRNIDDSLIKDTPTTLTSLVHGSDAEIELAITHDLREKQSKGTGDKTNENDTSERDEYILELVGEMHDILQNIKKYTNNDIFKRAANRGVDKFTKIQEVIQQNLHEYYAAKIKITGALNVSDRNNNEERDMLIGLVTDQLLKTYTKFLKPPVSKKEEEFEAKITKLDPTSRNEMNKKWKEEKGILLDAIEQAFKAEIQSLTKTQILDLERDDTIPGLFRLDIVPQPGEENAQIENPPKPNPPKKPARISGFFKRLFG